MEELFLKTQFEESGKFDTYSAYGCSLKVFNNELYVAFSNSYDGNNCNLESKVYKLLNNRWIQVGQGILTETAFGCSLETFNNELYVVFSNSYNGGSWNTKSKIYKLVDNTWIQVGNDIFTYGPYGCSLKVFNNELYVAFSNSFNGYTWNLNSRVYKLVEDSWIQVGNDILTHGAYGCSLEVFNNELYVVFSNSYKGTISNLNLEKQNSLRNTWNIESKIYKLVEDSWIQVGNDIPTNKATGNSLKVYNNELYVAFNNSYDEDYQKTNSRVYKLIKDKWIQVGQDILANAPTGCCLKVFNDELYLAISNSFNGTTCDVNSKIYKLVENTWVEVVSNITTNKATDCCLEVFNNELYVAFSNSYKDNNYNTKSYVYKVNIW